MPKEEIDERTRRIFDVYQKEYLSYEDIGKLEDISKERVRQIITNHPEFEARDLSAAKIYRNQRRSIYKKYPGWFYEKLLNYGYYPEDVARLTDLTVTDIKKSIADNTYTDNDVEPIREVNAEEIISLYKSGKSPEYIAPIYGVSDGFITTFLKSNGIKPRSKTEAQRIRKRKLGMSEKTLFQIKVRFDQGESLAAIARDLELSYSKLQRNFRRFTEKYDFDSLPLEEIKEMLED